MKTLIIYSVLLLCTAVINAQEVIQLKETKVESTPVSSLVRNGNSFSYSIKESYKGEFERDPLVFLKTHFDIKPLLEEVKDRRMSIIEVTLRSSKGFIWAGFDQKGHLRATSQRFENIMLPIAICHQLYEDHKGWSMVKNLHVARGTGDKITRDYYRITMENGKKRKTFKIFRTGNEQFELAKL